MQEEIPFCEAAARQLCDYVERTLDDRRRTSRGDFLSTFLAAADSSAPIVRRNQQGHPRWHR
jgi:cytochrome P450